MSIRLDLETRMQLMRGFAAAHAPSKKTVAAIAALAAFALIACNFQAIRAFATKHYGQAQQLIGGNHASDLASKPIDVRPPTTFGVQDGMWGWHQG